MVKYPYLKDGNLQRVGKKISVLANLASEKAAENLLSEHNVEQKHPNLITKSADPRSTLLEFRLGLSISQRRNSHFTGREFALSQISDTFLRKNNDQCDVLVLFGMGGIGKTQLALEYAYQAQNNFSSIFWIDGSSEETALRSIRSILERVENHYRVNGIDESSRRFEAIHDTLHPEENANLNRLSLVVSEAERSRSLRNAFRDWLSYEDNQDWLLVIDNLDDLESFDFNQLLPERGGSVLMTSRRPDLTVNLKSIEVTEMDVAEALTLLENTAGFRLHPENPGEQ